MLFNFSKFGETIRNAVVKSLYSENGALGVPSPPPTTFYLLDNTGEILFDNTDEPLLTN